MKLALGALLNAINVLQILKKNFNIPIHSSNMSLNFFEKRKIPKLMLQIRAVILITTKDRSYFISKTNIPHDFMPLIKVIISIAYSSVHLVENSFIMGYSLMKTIRKRETLKNTEL